MTGCLDLCLALAGLLCMCRCRWRRCCCRWDCSAEVASEAVGETGGLASNSTYEVHENFMSFRCVMPGVMLCSWKLVEAGTCVPRFADGSTHQTFDAPSLTSRQLSGLSLVAVTPDTQSPTPQIFLEQNAHYADPFVLRSCLIRRQASHFYRRCTNSQHGDAYASSGLRPNYAASRKHSP